MKNKNKNANLITDSIIDFTEAQIDDLLNNEIIKDVPVIKSLLAVLQTGITIRDKMFLNKMMTFLNQLSDISQEKILKEVRRIDNSKHHRQKIGDTLCYIIDRSSDADDAELVALLFRAYIIGDITYDDFLACQSIVISVSAHKIKWYVC